MDGYVDVDPRENWTTGLSVSTKEEKLLLSGSCGLTADVVDEHSFEVNAKECSRRGGNCDILDRTKTGKGTLSEDGLTLTLTFAGDSVQTNCLNPANDGLWTYTTELKLQRQ